MSFLWSTVSCCSVCPAIAVTRWERCLRPPRSKLPTRCPRGPRACGNEALALGINARGQVVGLVEVMKTFNQIQYGGAGLPEEAEVLEIRADEGAEIRAGQVLVVVR